MKRCLPIFISVLIVESLNGDQLYLDQ